MSLFTKVKMSPLKGQENGRTTEDERQRIEPVGSDAKAVRKTHEPKGSGQDPGLKYTPDQTLAESLSPKRSGKLDIQTARSPEQQSFGGRREEVRLEFTEDQISRLWTDISTRKVSGQRETQALG